MLYFPHDTDAMSDDRLLALRIDAGLEAIAVYWVVLEKIYDEESPFSVLETDVGCKSVLFRLGVGFDRFTALVDAMVECGLLVRLDDGFSVMSERAAAQIEALDKKRETARENGKKGGRKPTSKPKRNRRGTNVGTDAEPKSVTNKTINVIGSHKGNLLPEDGAAAEKTAPPSELPTCPRCGSTVMFAPSRCKWTCPECGDIDAPIFREAS